MIKNTRDNIRCKTCKWFRPCSSPEYREDGACMYNPPVFDTSSWNKGRPYTHMNDYCSRWDELDENAVKEK